MPAEEMGIITKVDQLTHQVVVNPIVVVRKSNVDVRICLDPVDLNKAVKRELTLPLNDGGRGSRKYVRSESFLNR